MQKRVFKKVGLLFSILVMVAPPALSEISEQIIYENRYSTLKVGAELSQRQLLESIIELDTPEQVTTVGGLLELLLIPQGYQLEDKPKANDHFLLLMLPLPESLRRLGPITLREAIHVLGGDGFQPLINPVKRTVSYQLHDELHQFVSDEDMGVAKENWLIQKEYSLPIPTVATQIGMQDITDQHYGPVHAEETLSGVVSQLDFPGLSVDQALVMLFQANPHAFVTRNMNHLIQGVMLYVPNVDDENIIPHTEASQIVDEHYQRWMQGER